MTKEKNGLKQNLERIANETKEMDNATDRKFTGAGWIGVSIDKGIGKALGIKKDSYYGYLLFSSSTGGQFDYLETKVREICKEFNKKMTEAGKVGVDIRVKYL